MVTVPVLLSLQNEQAFLLSTFSRACALCMVLYSVISDGPNRGPLWPFSERRFVIHAAAAPEGAGRGRTAPRVVLGTAGTPTATTGGGIVATAAGPGTGPEAAATAT